MSIECREFHLAAEDGFSLAAERTEVENPAAVLQLIHGASEHRKRYRDFMSYLSKHNVACVITDLRGHGESVSDAYPIGFMDGIDRMVRDQLTVTEYIAAEFPGAHIGLFGHSFGSLIARSYLQQHDERIDSLILSGTVNYNPLVGLGLAVGGLFTKLGGPRGRSAVIERLNVVGHDDCSWLSSNEENIRNYLADPLCGFKYYNAGSMTMFEAMKRLHDFDRYACKQPQLPILSVSGEGDPITGGAKGLEDTVRSLERIGYRSIKNLVYPGMKHEVLNEVDKMRVYEDILSFLTSE